MEVSESSEKLSGKFPKDWRKLRDVLSPKEKETLANLSADGVKKVSQKYGVDERTVINWRLYARKELGIQ